MKFISITSHYVVRDDEGNIASNLYALDDEGRLWVRRWNNWNKWELDTSVKTIDEE